MWEPEWMTLKTNLNYIYKWLKMKKSSVYIPFCWLLLCYCNRQMDIWAPVKLYINIRMCTLKFWPPRWSRQREMARIYNIWNFQSKWDNSMGCKIRYENFNMLRYLLDIFFYFILDFFHFFFINYDRQISDFNMADTPTTSESGIYI